MPSPIGHEIAGFLIYDVFQQFLMFRRRLKVVSLCLLVAILPDFDFVMGILEGEPNRYHHGLSHSLFVGLLVSVLLSTVFFYHGRLWVYILLLFSIYSSHIILDLLSLDRTSPYGLQLLWPIDSEYYISAKSIFSDIRRENSNNEFFSSLIMNKHNYLAILREIATLVPPLAAVKIYAWWRKSRGQT